MSEDTNNNDGAVYEVFMIAKIQEGFQRRTKRFFKGLNKLAIRRVSHHKNGTEGIDSRPKTIKLREELLEEITELKKLLDFLENRIGRGEVI